MIPSENKRFHIGYNLTVTVGINRKTTSKETTISGASISAAIAFFKQEIIMLQKSQKPLININFCVEVEK